METIAACRHTSAKADGSPLEFGESGLCVAASRSHRRGPRWQTEGVENLSGYGGILDGGQNAHPRVASRAFQNIQCEHPRHQLSPHIIARARILLFGSISMSARFSSRNRRRGREKTPLHPERYCPHAPGFGYSITPRNSRIGQGGKTAFIFPMLFPGVRLRTRHYAPLTGCSRRRNPKRSQTCC